MQNLNNNELIDIAIKNKEGILTNSGVLAVDTGVHTGRSPNAKKFVLEQHHHLRAQRRSSAVLLQLVQDIVLSEWF